MDDTTPEIAQRVCEMFQEKSPTERLKMGCAMYEMSKKLVIRAILEEDPLISASDLRKELFLKFYRDEFSERERQKIFDHFDQLPT